MSVADADAGHEPVSATCVSGGDCSPNDCQTGTWGCVDGGRVCQLTPATEGTPCTSATADAGAHVCHAGQCVGCNAGADCSDPSTCVKKSVDCTTGAPVCKMTGNVADGTGCGAGLYCNAGSCAPCLVGAPCTPAANACHVGKVTACTGGVPVCTDQGTNAPPGTACNAAGAASAVCNSGGTCAPCSKGAQCNPNGNTCQLGTQSCSAGPACQNAVSVQEGKACAAGICHAGACGACDGASCPSGCCDSSGCVTTLQSTAVCGTGAGGGACTACGGPSVGTGSPKCSGNACTFACTGATPNACPGIGCVDLQNDDSHCGQCGTKCGASTHCKAGACACIPKPSPCGNAVCGQADDGCGHMVTCLPGCTPPMICDAAGSGTCSCPSGLIRCGGTCVDETTNNTPNAPNCGGCGASFACTGGKTCQGGACACPPGFVGCTTSCPSAGVSCIKPVAVAVGGAHGCALLSTGDVECWGDNGYGQLGTPPQANTYATPSPVPNVSGATDIRAASQHSCALSAGTWRCWGESFNDEIGARVNGPLPPAGVFSGATLFSTGSSATCANVAGSVQCLGDATYGEIGTSAGPEPCPGTSGSCSSAPVIVSSPLLNGVKSLSTSGRSVCAVTSGGSVVCWGSDATGQIGPNGASSTCTQPGLSAVPCSPAAVTVPGVGNALSVVTGYSFACALIQGGTVQCWGDNQYAELGSSSTALCETSTTPCSTTPIVVAGVMNATAIAAGDDFACALLRDGTIRCWGSNSNNQLGVASVSGTCPVPLGASVGCSPTPVTVSGVANATFIAAGAQTACALIQDGTVQCWGSDSLGQLGNGSGVGGMTAVTLQW